MKQMTLALLASLSLAGTVVPTAAAQENELVVGGKNFTEQQLISSITTQYLDHLGYDVDRRAGMGSSVLRQAQENGQVDLYWEYTGTSLIVYNDVEEKLGPDEAYARVKELDAEKGLVWLEPSGVNNTYALAMRAEDAEERGIATISDLATVVNDGAELVFASNAEFYARDDGLRPMQEIYGFSFGRANIKRMDTGLTYSALRDEQVDVAIATTTDGRLSAFNLTVLEDDKGFFPPYAMTPVVNQQALDDNPDLEAQLNELSARLDDDSMRQLNERVDVDRQTVEDVAEDFLINEGLIDA
ncbi:glycine/betaine ABC transporter substrate-binding protein [Halomonas cupida]|uniref:Glycine/betaine ABC transporter substrate-binding protein n=1 Tax=Halomonas cupida TaxID=44933 RepID=A0A1M7K7X1_9GAMM|nr:glycine betaine ABC transporter substrate-binding protein [Halomonas cupida]GEN24978.1 glycine/betaine ABC transporter substrate-binding protein [Halomonas cupida]SHM61370.1 osmoprotectant transport system substrate-binding protein [Halomonas cupida]